VKKTSGSTTTFYLWDNENLIAEYSAAGQRTKRYAYIPNRHAALQIEDANGVYHVHTNHLDTPTQLTDSTQKIVWQANYQAFGNTQINQDPDANGKSIVYNQRFPGQYQDVETNLYYNFYRDYDPATGRYLQSDPIGLNGGINLYSYVLGNPLYWVDATGETASALAIPAVVGGIALCILSGACIPDLPQQPDQPAYPGDRPDCPGGTPPLFSPPQFDNPFMNSGSGEEAEKPYAGNTPEDRPEDFHRGAKPGQRENKKDGSVWEKDHSGHGGSEWKRWPSRKDREKNRNRESVRPDGSVR
jgi:hypothetical protein